MYKIYEIRCNETDEVYIGMTTRTLEERLNEHKNYNSISSKQIILRGDYIMSEIDECNNEEESIELEAHYIRNTDNCINRNIPGRTRQERYKENKYYEVRKDKYLEYGKKYREKNKDKINEKGKVKYTCDCSSIIRKDSKAKHEKSLTHINFINSK